MILRRIEVLIFKNSFEMHDAKVQVPKLEILEVMPLYTADCSKNHNDANYIRHFQLKRFPVWQMRRSMSLGGRKTIRSVVFLLYWI